MEAFFEAGAAAFFVAAVLAGLFALSWWTSDRQRFRRSLRNQRAVAIAEAPDGERVRIEGSVRLLEPLQAPFSGRACAAYDVSVVDRDKLPLVILAAERRVTDFIVDDGSCRARVLGSSALASIVLDAHWRSGLLADAEPQLEAFLQRRGEKSTHWIGMNRPLGYREGVIAEGERVVVMGRAHWEPDPDVDRQRAAGSYRASSAPRRLVISGDAHEAVHVSDDPAFLEPRPRRGSK